MKLSILLVLFGISQVFGKIPLEQGACVEGAYCKFTLISNDKSTMGKLDNPCKPEQCVNHPNPKIKNYGR